MMCLSAKELWHDSKGKRKAIVEWSIMKSIPRAKNKSEVDNQGSSLNAASMSDGDSSLTALLTSKQTLCFEKRHVNGVVIGQNGWYRDVRCIYS